MRLRNLSCHLPMLMALRQLSWKRQGFEGINVMFGYLFQPVLCTKHFCKSDTLTNSTWFFFHLFAISRSFEALGVHTVLILGSH